MYIITRETLPPPEREIFFDPQTILIFPFEPAVESAKRQYLEQEGYILGIRFISLFRLLFELAQRIPLVFSVPDEICKRFLMQRLLDGSKYFSKSSSFIVDDFIALDSILPENLSNITDLLPYQIEAIDIIKDFRAKLETARFTRITKLYELVAERLSKDIVTSALPNVKRLVFRGFFEFTEGEQKFVFSLSRFFDEIRFEIEREPEPYFAKMYLPGINLERSIKKLAKENCKLIDCRVKNEALSTMLAALCFPEKSISSPIQIVALKDRFDEVAYVLSEIKENLQHGGSVRDHLILVNQMETYAPIFELLADSFGIQVQLIGYGGLIKEPLAKTVLKFLRVVEKGLSFEYLQDFILDYHLDSFGKPQVDDLCALYGFSSLVSTDETTIQLELEHNPSPELERILDFLQSINIWRKRFLKCSSVEEFCSLLLEFVDNLNVLEPQESQAKEALFSIVDELKKISIVVGEPYLPLSDTIALLEELVMGKRIEGKNFGVIVCRPEEGAFIPANKVYIVGLVDGEYPPVERSNLVFSDGELKALGVQRNYRFRHIYSFLRNVSRTKAKVKLTYPVYDGDVKKLRSWFIFPFSNVEKKRASCKNAPFGYQIELGRAYSSIYIELRDSSIYDMFLPKIIKDLLNLQFKRHYDKPIDEYSGIISKELLNEPNIKARVGSSLLSVSNLESYIECPFKFFVSKILRLRDVKEPQEELDPLGWGEIVHEILKDFYADRIRRVCDYPLLSFDSVKNLYEGFESISVGHDNIESAKDEMIGRVKKVVSEKLARRFPYLIEFYTARLNALLLRFLEIEKEGQRGMPFAVEVAFGPVKRASCYVTNKPYIIGSNIMVNGIIDRLEITRDGEIILVDYKSGGVPAKTDIIRGVKIQLPLYVLAIKEILSGFGLDVAGFAYYTLNPREVKRDPVFGKFEKRQRIDFDELLAKTEDIVMDVARKIESGEFHYNVDDENICARCELSFLCRRFYSEGTFFVGGKERSANTIPFSTLFNSDKSIS